MNNNFYKRFDSSKYNENKPTRRLVPHGASIETSQQPRPALRPAAKPTSNPAINYAPAPAPIEYPRAVLGTVDIMFTKEVLGAQIPAGEFFEFGLYDDQDNLIATAQNDDTGLVVFSGVESDAEGTVTYTIREEPLSPTLAALFEKDDTEFEVNVLTVDNGDGTYTVSVNYDGLQETPSPVFFNTSKNAQCGLVEFPELIFDTPGTYIYTLKETSISGAGWDTDDTEYTVEITVIDDGYGNYIATAKYFDENGAETYPEFTNIFAGNTASITISACKTALIAPAPAGKFQFGLFDSTGQQIGGSVTNDAVAKSATRDDKEVATLARRYALSKEGKVYESGYAVSDTKLSERRPIRTRVTANDGTSGSSVCAGDDCVVERRLEQKRRELARLLGR